LDEVVEALSDKGFVPLEDLREIGVIIGESPNKAIRKLEQTPGVSVVVEDKKDFQLLSDKKNIKGTSPTQGQPHKPKRNTKPVCQDVPFVAENLFDHSGVPNDNHAMQLYMRTVNARSTHLDPPVREAEHGVSGNARRLHDDRAVTPRKRPRKLSAAS
jgi:hypothetical protein